MHCRQLRSNFEDLVQEVRNGSVAPSAVSDGVPSTLSGALKSLTETLQATKSATQVNTDGRGDPDTPHEVASDDRKDLVEGLMVENEKLQWKLQVYYFMISRVLFTCYSSICMWLHVAFRGAVGKVGYFHACSLGKLHEIVNGV